MKIGNKNRVEKLVIFSIAAIMCMSILMIIPQASAYDYEQPPNPIGWDVLAMMPDNILADDFQCTETGYITHITFWGSWYNDIMPPGGKPLGFHISFHADIPDPDGTGPLYSMPGDLLWEQDVYNFVCTPEIPSPQGWFEPIVNYFEPIGNHQMYFRYDVDLTDPYFMQSEGAIYWLDIAPYMQGIPGVWGWKTSIVHFNDDAVYSYPATPPQTILTQNFDSYVPAQPILPGWSTSGIATIGWYQVPTSNYMRCNRLTGQASDEWLKSPVLDFTGQTSVTLQEYMYFYNTSSDTGGTHLYIYGSTDGGLSWTQTIAHYTATTSGTFNYDISLWAAGQSNVKIAWRFICPSTTTVYDYVYIDTLKFGNFVFPPQGWVVYNVDGGDQWVQYATSPHSGVYDASCLYDLPNNDWIASRSSLYSGVQPFSLWLAKGSSSYNAETCTIYYSTVGNTVANFLANAPLMSVSPPTVAPIYTQYTEGISFPTLSSLGVPPNVPVWFAVQYTGNNQLRVYTDDWVFPDGSTEGFEATVYYSYNFDQWTLPIGWPPAGWTHQVVSGTDTDNYWKIYPGDGTNPTGVVPTSLPYMVEYDVMIISTGNSARLYTPSLAFSGIGHQLSFNMYHDDDYTTKLDRVEIQVSTDGSTWTTISTFYTWAATEGWQNHVVSLSAYDGQPSIYIGFLGVSDYGYNNVYLDDIKITTQGSPAGWGELRDPITHESLDLAFEIIGIPSCPAVCRNVEDNIEYCTIQSAIDAATTSNGEHIEIYAGTHDEQVNVYKSLTLYGLPTTIIQSNPFPVITVSANNVVITDVTITSPVQLVEGIRVVAPATTGLTLERVIFPNVGAGTGNNAYAINIQNTFSGLLVEDCDFTSVAHTTYYRTIGLFAQNNLNLNNFKVSNSTFTTIWTGIYLRSAINNLKVLNNIFQQQQVSTDTGGCAAGVYIGDGSTGNFNIQNIEVANNTFTGFIRGVYVWNYATNAIIGSFNIHDNTFTNGLWSSPIRFIAGNAGTENVGYTGPITIHHNTFTQTAELTPAAAVGWIDFRAYGELPTCNIAITNNTITFSGTYTHAKYGIKFAAFNDAFYNVLVENNLIQGNNVLDGKTGTIASSAIVIDHYSSTQWPTDVFGITVKHNNLLGFDNGFCIYDLVNARYGGFPTVNNVHVNYNNIVGNTIGIRNNNPGLIDGECNWYGTYLGPTHPSNPGGTGDPVTDNVDFIPWLNFAFEDPKSVCEGVPCVDTVYVDDDYKDTTPGMYIDHFPTIQMALDKLGAGGTAIIYDGEYDEDLIIDDFPCDNTGITIMGEYECFPTDEAAVIQGHAIISVDDVTIKYLEFKPTTDAAITVADGVTGTTLEFNKFRRDCITDAIGVQALNGAIVDAEHNWWGAQDGPNGGMMDDGKTPDGNGVILIGEVLVEPWIGIHAEISQPIGTIEVSLGTPVTFDATGSFAYSFGECCELTALPMQYLWDFGDGSLSSNLVATHIFEQTGTYQVALMVDSEGIPGLYANFMYDWAYVTVHVVTEDTTLTANADGGNLGGYETIVDEPVQLYGDAYGGNGEYIWHWNFGDQTADSNLQNPIHTYTQPGTYTATLTVISDGETATDTAEVRVYDIDELFVTINDANAIAGVEAMFAASIKGGSPPYTVSWDFGDGTTSQENRPTHIYSNPGEYTITVIVTDNKQKTDQDTAIITVEEENIIEEAEIKEVKAGLGVTAVIDAGESNCHWEITVEGKVFLGGENSGTIDANTQDTVRLGFSLAFGEVNIVVKAAGMQKEYTAFALGPLYFNLQEV